MSSIKTVTGLPVDGKGGCSTRPNVISFLYTWTISGFSLLLHQRRREALLSPIFSMGKEGEYKWRLEAYRHCNYMADGESSGQLTLRLVYLHTKSNAQCKAKVVISISAEDETLYELDSRIDYFGKNLPGMQCFDFMKKIKLMPKRPQKILTNDVLTLVCHITIIEEGWTTKSHDPEVSDELPEFRLPDDDLLRDLFESSKLHDVTLVAACGREFRAHKAILATRSSVFSAMFENEMREQRENRVDITDVDGKVLNEMLRFIYTGKATNLDTLADGLLVAADKYQLDRLKWMCTKELGNGISIENAADLLIITDRHCADHLKTQVLNFIFTHPSEVLKSQSYKSMCDTHPKLIQEILSGLLTKQNVSKS